jgi:hypothetical protein
MKILAWRPHDLRRPQIIEACLNHISGAKAGVAGVYNRATYAPEKRTALERWAAHVQSLMSRQPKKVTLIRKKVA